MQEDLLKELKDISILCVEDEDGIREMIVSTLKFYFKEVYAILGQCTNERLVQSSAEKIKAHDGA